MGSGCGVGLGEQGDAIAAFGGLEVGPVVGFPGDLEPEGLIEGRGAGMSSTRRATWPSRCTAIGFFV